MIFCQDACLDIIHKETWVYWIHGSVDEPWGATAAFYDNHIRENHKKGNWFQADDENQCRIARDMGDWNSIEDFNIGERRHWHVEVEVSLCCVSDTCVLMRKEGCSLRLLLAAEHRFIHTPMAPSSLPTRDSIIVSLAFEVTKLTWTISHCLRNGETSPATFMNSKFVSIFRPFHIQNTTKMQTQRIALCQLKHHARQLLWHWQVEAFEGCPLQTLFSFFHSIPASERKDLDSPGWS